MTAYLQPGDKILIAVPDVFPGNTVTDDRSYWRSVYEPLGVTVHHIAIDQRLTHPVVVAVFRNQTTEETEPA